MHLDDLNDTFADEAGEWNDGTTYIPSDFSDFGFMGQDLQADANGQGSQICLGITGSGAWSADWTCKDPMTAKPFICYQPGPNEWN